jgi:hypothetical protein
MLEMCLILFCIYDLLRMVREMISWVSDRLKSLLQFSSYYVSTASNFDEVF